MTRQIHRQADRIHFDPKKKEVSVTDTVLGRKVRYPVDSCVLEIREIDEPFVVENGGKLTQFDADIPVRINRNVLPAGEYLTVWFAWGGNGYSFYRAL